MSHTKMTYNPLFGSITYESKSHGPCRLLDYADEWKNASEEEKDHIQLAAAAPELLAACQAAVEWMSDQLDDVKSMEHMLDGHDPEQCVYCQCVAAVDKAVASC
jgi:hypothetical protein